MADDQRDTFKLVVRVPRELVTRFRIECIKSGLTMQEGAAQALAGWLRAQRERRTKP